ncbi:hypothetical protein ACWEJ6_53975 [Nonomuraea sp. NPDC004702]
MGRRPSLPKQRRTHLAPRDSLHTSNHHPAHGDSIAVNAVRLTVVEVNDDVFTVDVIGESLDHSSLGGLTAGSALNLDRSVHADQRLCVLAPRGC